MAWQRRVVGRRNVQLRGTRYRVAIRSFLNKPGFHGRASLVASVEDTSRLPEEELRFHRLPKTYLSISDCSRECALEFDIGTRDHQRNSLHKLRVLIGGLEAFRDALEEEIVLYNERVRKGALGW